MLQILCPTYWYSPTCCSIQVIKTFIEQDEWIYEVYACTTPQGHGRVLLKSFKTSSEAEKFVEDLAALLNQ